MRQFLARQFPQTYGFLYRHRHHAPVAALLIGLVWDSLTLGRPDGIFDNAVLLTYLVIAGIGILHISYRRERGRLPALWVPTLVQFAFGNLTSGLFVLYNISATIAGSWPFLLLLVGMLVGNELIKERYAQLRFNISVYYILLLAYLILIVPVLARDVGPEIFLQSSVVSLLCIGTFVMAVWLLAPITTYNSRAEIIAAVSVILVTFNTLYFSNTIPPVPMALRDMGIFHEVTRNNDAYNTRYVQPAWYEPLERSDDVVYLGAGGAAYCFSSVFAPPGIVADIVHAWRVKDPESGEWKSRTRVPFAIVGGRDAGFRGFSTKKNLEPGTWQCRIETDWGALIGQRTFEVVTGTPERGFIEDTR
jgi:hypothetical protein